MRIFSSDFFVVIFQSLEKTCFFNSVFYLIYRTTYESQLNSLKAQMENLITEKNSLKNKFGAKEGRVDIIHLGRTRSQLQNIVEHS